MTSTTTSRQVRPVEDWDSDFFFAPSSSPSAASRDASSSRLPRTPSTSAASRRSPSSIKGKEKASPESFFEGWNDSPPRLSDRAMRPKPLDLLLRSEREVEVQQEYSGSGLPTALEFLQEPGSNEEDSRRHAPYPASAPAGSSFHLDPPISEVTPRSKLVKPRSSRPSTPTRPVPRIAEQNSTDQKPLRHSKSRDQMPPPAGLLRSISKKRAVPEEHPGNRSQARPLQPSNQQASASPATQGKRSSSFWKRLSGSPALIGSPASQRRRSSVVSPSYPSDADTHLSPHPSSSPQSSSASSSATSPALLAISSAPQRVSQKEPSGSPGLAALLRRSSSNLVKRKGCASSAPRPPQPHVVHRSQLVQSSPPDASTPTIPVRRSSRAIGHGSASRSASTSSGSSGGFHLPTTSPGSPYAVRQASGDVSLPGLTHATSASSIPTIKSLSAALEGPTVDPDRTPRRRKARPLSALPSGATSNKTGEFPVPDIDDTIKLGIPLQSLDRGTTRSKSSRRAKTEAEAWDDDFADLGGPGTPSKLPRPSLGSSQSSHSVIPLTTLQRQTEAKRQRRQSFPDFIIPAAVLEKQKRVKEGNAAIKNFRRGIKVLQQYQTAHLEALDRAASGGSSARAQWAALEMEYAEAWEEAALLIKVASTGQDEWTQPSFSNPSPTRTRRVTMASEEAKAAAEVLRRVTPSSRSQVDTDGAHNIDGVNISPEQIGGGLEMEPDVRMNKDKWRASSGRGDMNTAELRLLRHITTGPVVPPIRSLSQPSGFDTLVVRPEARLEPLAQPRHVSAGSAVSSSSRISFPSSASSSGFINLSSFPSPNSAEGQSFAARRRPSKSVLAGLKDFIRSLPLRPRPERALAVPLELETKGSGSQTPSRISSRSSTQSQAGGGLFRTLSRAKSRQNAAAATNPNYAGPSILDRPKKLSAGPTLPSIESQKTLHALSLTPPRAPAAGEPSPEDISLPSTIKSTLPSPSGSQWYVRVAPPPKEQHKKRPSVRNIFGSSRRTPSMAGRKMLPGELDNPQASPAPSLPSAVPSVRRTAVPQSPVPPSPSPNLGKQGIWARAISRARTPTASASSLSLNADSYDLPSPAQTTGKGSIRAGWGFPSTTTVSTTSPAAQQTDGDQTVRPLRHKKRQSGLGHGQPSLSAGRVEDMPFLSTKAPASATLADHSRLSSEVRSVAPPMKRIASSPSSPTKSTTLHRAQSSSAPRQYSADLRWPSDTSSQSALSAPSAKSAPQILHSAQNPSASSAQYEYGRTFSSETARTEMSEQSTGSGVSLGLGRGDMVIHLTPENIPQLLGFLKACERRLAEWRSQVDQAALSS